MDSASSDSDNQAPDPAPYSDFPMPDAHPQDDPWLATTTAASAPASVVSHASSLPLGASALSTPPSSVALAAAPAPKGKLGSKTVNGSLALRPQFNLDSAAGLLATFRGVMLAHFPCVVLEEDDEVGAMARERPFVLLAVLAAASSSRSLQGHSLYDEEFRKVLGFKFVAGGERSLELLQGLVIYVAWYVRLSSCPLRW